MQPSLSAFHSSLSSSPSSPDMIFHKQVPFSELYIDKRELYLLMGYGDQTPDGMFLEIIDEMLAELATCCTPEFGYVILPGHRIDREQIQVADTILVPGRTITSYLREADSFAIFTATVGANFDQWNHALQKRDDMVRTFFADSLGSILAEACATVMTSHLEQEMNNQGLFISNNYSPGYCDWPLVEQKKLFSFFPEGFCGVTLTDSCLMLPIKSVSGIAGIGKQVKKRPYGCDICGMKDCIKNRNKS